jgi:hypothetical protein
MIVIITLIYTVSLAPQLPSYATIHNQCSKTKLVSPVHFVNGAVCPKLSNQQIDIDTAMNVNFEIYATRDNFEGALIYKVQIYASSQHNMNTSETDDNKAKHVYMLVAWKMKDSKSFVYVVLVEHAKKFIWNEDKLKRFYYENHNRFKEYDDIISDTWFMNDTTLKTSFRVEGMNGNFELIISISEEERDDYAMKPLCIDLKR